MSHWEKFLHAPMPDVLVQLAIVHAEFESLHPFLDGNGRIGRIVIPLFLYARNQLHAPMFYPSEHLEANRQEYCDRLLAVSRDDDWTGWCCFFLDALIQQARQNANKTRKILDLYESRKDQIPSVTRSPHAIKALDFIFKTPVFNAKTFVNESRIPAPTARRILNVLADRKLLRTIRQASGAVPQSTRSLNC